MNNKIKNIIIERYKEELKNLVDDKNKKIIKTVKMTPKLKEIYDELDKSNEAVKNAKQKRSVLYDEFWGGVHREFGYDYNFSIKDDKKTIEIY